jgi:hypothetical protein
MLKFTWKIGGAEEDRTPDLLIANETTVSIISGLRSCCAAISSWKLGGECTNWAQCLCGRIEVGTEHVE